MGVCLPENIKDTFTGLKKKNENSAVLVICFHVGGIVGVNGLAWVAWSGLALSMHFNLISLRTN